MATRRRDRLVAQLGKASICIALLCLTQRCAAKPPLHWTVDYIPSSRNGPVRCGELRVLVLKRPGGGYAVVIAPASGEREREGDRFSGRDPLDPSTTVTIHDDTHNHDVSVAVVYNIGIKTLARSRADATCPKPV